MESNAYDDWELCPCSKCNGQVPRLRRTIEEHLVSFGRMSDSTPHQQVNSPRPTVQQEIHADSPIAGEPFEDLMMAEAEEVAELLGQFYGGDGSTHQLHPQSIHDVPLCAGNDLKQIPAILLLLNLQATYGWSDNSVTALFRLLREKFLPPGNTMLKSHAEAKRFLGAMGLPAEFIHACPNDCQLFDNERQNETSCQHCGGNRYRDDVLGTKIPKKVLRYMPLIPRIKHFFASLITAKHLGTNSNLNKRDVAELRGPSDSEAWKHIDDVYPEFLYEARHLRIAICTDGFNPYSLRSSRYTVWPVVIIIYNLPHGMSTKPAFMLLTLIIPGKSQVGNMDTYYRPLFLELQKLWNPGCILKDISRPQEEEFIVRAIVMWTISDYPGVSACSGLSTSGYNACYSCMDQLEARWSAPLRKCNYPEFRMFLDEDHDFRDSLKQYFNGLPEFSSKPRKHGAQDWHDLWISSQQNIGMEASTSQATRRPRLPEGMNRYSIFHELEYWKKLKIHHLLDPMHVLQNVCKSLIDHLIGEKDTESSRADLKITNTKKILWDKQRNARGKMEFMKAPYILSSSDRKDFFETLKHIRTLTGFGAVLYNAFNKKDNKFAGLKSHDFLNILRYHLPVAVIGKASLSDGVKESIYRLSRYARVLCMKVVQKDKLELLEREAPIMCSLLQMQFPTSFFDSQEHLLVHLPEEVRLAGPVHMRWMFFVERYIKNLKTFVRQRARPEGSIGEGYRLQETMGIHQSLIGDLDEYAPRLWKEIEDIHITGQELQGKGKVKRFSGYDDINHRQINICMIKNSPLMKPYVDRYNDIVAEYTEALRAFRDADPQERRIRPKPMADIDDWIRVTVQQEEDNQLNIDSINFEDEAVKDISLGCDHEYKSFSSMFSYGRHFRRHSVDKHRRTCDSGIACRFLEGDHIVDHVGILQDIVEVNFRTAGKLVLLKIQWYGRNTTWNECLLFSKDQTSNLRSDRIEDIPFIPPHCAEQVFFIQDPSNYRNLFVLQDNPLNYVVFDSIEPASAWNDGSHVIGLEAGALEMEDTQELRRRMRFRERMKFDINDNTHENYESADSDDEQEMRGVERDELILDSHEDSDYGSRRTRIMDDLYRELGF